MPRILCWWPCPTLIIHYVMLQVCHMGLCRSAFILKHCTQLYWFYWLYHTPSEKILHCVCVVTHTLLMIIQTLHVVLSTACLPGNIQWAMSVICGALWSFVQMILEAEVASLRAEQQQQNKCSKRKEMVLKTVTVTWVYFLCQLSLFWCQ